MAIHSCLDIYQLRHLVISLQWSKGNNSQRITYVHICTYMYTHIYIHTNIYHVYVTHKTDTHIRVQIMLHTFIYELAFMLLHISNVVIDG